MLQRERKREREVCTDAGCCCEMFLPEEESKWQVARGSSDLMGVGVDLSF